MPRHRPGFLPVLLCLFVSVGHAPAWWHIATCDHDHAAVATSVDPQVNGQAHPSCGCCSHRDHAADDSAPHPGPTDESQHDSDRCHLCQSSAAPGGLTHLQVASGQCVWQREVLDPVPPLTLRAAVAPRPPTRGPPPVVAAGSASLV